MGLCFSVYFCALADACYQRQAPGCAGRRSSIPGALASTGISGGEPVLCLDVTNPLKEREAVRFPTHYKGWDLLLFQGLPACKRHIFKGAKHSSVFCTLMHKGWMKVLRESWEAVGHFPLALGIPGCDGGRSANSACALQQCGFSWAFFFFNVERVAESLESFAEKYNLCESRQGALRVQNARGKRMVLQLTWEICFAKFLCCFKLIRLICDTVFLSSPHQALCVVSCLRNKGTRIMGFWDGSSNLVLMLMLCSLFIQALDYLLSPFVADCWLLWLHL